jgi:hypothetical protein
MEINMLRKALWVFLKPLITLITNLLNPEVGEEWLIELKKFLRKEQCWVLAKKAAQTGGEGNIHFTVTSNGMTREQWEQHLDGRGLRLSDWGRNVLRRASEAPTNGVTYNIVVRPGKKINDSDRITKKIRAAAVKKGWVKPHWEVACLIRDTLSDEQLEQMDLWYIVTMHEPIEDSGGGPYLLYSRRNDVGLWLYASYGRPDGYWFGGGGFAFAVPQVGTQT